MKIAAVVLAAGASRRSGVENKLLATDSRGRPMIARVVAAVCATSAAPVFLVTGYDSERVVHAVSNTRVDTVHAPHWADGMSATLQAALAALPGDTAGTLVCLGDMPGIAAATLQRLIDAFVSDEGRRIVVPTFEGRRGNPVLLPARLFPEVAALTGDQGARGLVMREAHATHTVAVDDPSVVADVDTPSALAEFSRVD